MKRVERGQHQLVHRIFTTLMQTPPLLLTSHFTYEGEVKDLPKANSVNENIGYPDFQSSAVTIRTNSLKDQQKAPSRQGRMLYSETRLCLTYSLLFGERERRYGEMWG